MTILARALLLALLLALPAQGAGIGGGGLREELLGNLHFLDIPAEPLPSAWTRAGLDLASFQPSAILGALKGAGRLGSAILDAVARSGYRRILVVFLRSRTIPSQVRSRMRELGFQQTRIDYGHSTLASWQDAGTVGLILLRIDRIAAQRRKGFGVSPAGSLAHELVHVGQSTWGSLPRGPRGRASGDVHDESEAWLVTQLVERAEVLRKGAGILNQGETRLLAAPPAATRSAIAGAAEQLARGPYRGLPMGPRYDKGRYSAARDPFASLPP